MILADFLAGWSRHPMVDGFVLLPPEGFQVGMIRVREKQPLRRFQAILRDLIAEAGPDYARVARVGPLTTFETMEGEHAGRVTVEANLGGERVERTIALVAGEDTCMVVDAGTSRPERFAAFREAGHQLADSYYMGLGAGRRRRFEYEVPPGWQGLGRPSVATWYPPGFPRAAAFITVFDARPLTRLPSEVEDRSLFIENRQVTMSGEEKWLPAGGLPGVIARGTGSADGRRITVLRARLEDSRFMYLAQLNAADDALELGELAFRRLLESIRAIPEPPVSEDRPLMYWLD